MFLISSSFAIAIDKSWYDNTKDVLEKLYTDQATKITNTKNNLSSEDKEQVEYQLILLKKLQSVIKEENTFVFKNIEDITTIDKYIEQVKEYLKIDENYNLIKNEFKDNNNKITLIEEQIDKLTSKDDIATINSQLLNAYYILKNKQNKATIEEYEKYLTNFKKILLSSLESAKFSIDTELSSKIEKLLENLNSLIKEEKKLSLAYDKAQITENQGKLKNIDLQIQQLDNDKDKLINQIVYLRVQELLPLLKNRESKYFDSSNSLQLFIQENQANYDSLIELFKHLSRERLGVTKTTFADTKQSFIDIVKFGWSWLNDPIIPIGDGVSILAVIKFC